MKNFLWLLGILILASCGGDDKGSNGNGVGRSVAFACDTTTCQSGSQYCQLVKVGQTTTARACAPLPASCQDCDCAMRDFGRSAGACASMSCHWDRDNDEAKRMTVRCGG